MRKGRHPAPDHGKQQGSPHCAKPSEHRIFPSSLTLAPVSFEATTESLSPSVHAHHSASCTPPRPDTRHTSECFTLQEGSLSSDTHRHQHSHDCVPMVAPRRRIEFHSDPTPDHRRIWPTVPLHTYLVATAPTVELAVSFPFDTRDSCRCRVLEWQGIQGVFLSMTVVANLADVAQHRPCIGHISSMSRRLSKGTRNSRQRQSCKLPHATTGMPLRPYPHPRIHQLSSPLSTR